MTGAEIRLAPLQGDQEALARPARSHGPAGVRRRAAGPAWVGLRPVLALCTAVGLLRLLIGWAMDAPLHLDEAQYWDWSRHLQPGYYSKPPGIAVLIAASTALFGDSAMGLRVLAMATQVSWAAVLCLLAGHWCGQDPLVRLDPLRRRDAQRVAVMTTALALASPASTLLGQVATTDAPLLLCWSLATAALWFWVAEGRRGALVLLAAAVAAGLWSKYAMAAWVAGAALWLMAPARWSGLDRHCQTRRPAAVLAIAVGALSLTPNLLWNARMDWPTLRHTAEITWQSQQVQGRSASALPSGTAAATASHGPMAGVARAAGYAATQALLVAPLVVPVFLAMAGMRTVRRWRWRWRWPARLATALSGSAGSRPGTVPGAGAGLAAKATAAQSAPIRPGRRAMAGSDGRCRRRAGWPPGALALLVLLHLPLAAAGLLQAGWSGAELNWVLALHTAALPMLGLALARWPRPEGTAWLLGAQAVLTLALVIAPAVARSLDHPLPRHLDLWGRMAGWTPALDALHTAWLADLRQHPTQPEAPAVVTLSRAVSAHLAHAWRGDTLRRAASASQALARPGSRAADHYLLQCPWQVTPDAQGRIAAAAAAPTVWLVTDSDWPAELQTLPGRLTPIARAQVIVGPDRQRRLRLARFDWDAAVVHRSRPSGPPGPSAPSSQALSPSGGMPPAVAPQRWCP